MDFFFQDPDEIRAAPEAVRLQNVQVQLQPGGMKVKVSLQLTPFQVRPNLEVSITTETGQEVAHTTILEAMGPKMELTMHLRPAAGSCKYSIRTTVYYQDLPEPGETTGETPLPAPVIVDRNEVTLTIPIDEP